MNDKIPDFDVLYPPEQARKVLRAYFIAAALPGVIQSLGRNQMLLAANKEAARGAIRVADAVIAEIESDEDVSDLQADES